MSEDLVSDAPVHVWQRRVAAQEAGRDRGEVASVRVQRGGGGGGGVGPRGARGGRSALALHVNTWENQQNYVKEKLAESSQS